MLKVDRNMEVVLHFAKITLAEAGNLKLDFVAKKHWNSVLWLEYIFRYYRDTKTTKTPLAI